MDYDTYLNKCTDIRKTNESLLTLFSEDLKKAGLAEKTIKRHLSNVDFYINEYLIRTDALPMKNGVTMIDDFLGNFFIRKCMWSEPNVLIGRVLFFPSTRIVFTALYVIEFLFFVHPSLMITSIKTERMDWEHQDHCR